MKTYIRKIIALICLVPSLCFGLTVYSPTDTSDPIQWDTFLRQMEFTRDPEIIIYWSGEGGYTDIGDDATRRLMIIGAKHNLKIYAVNESISMHAFMLCELSKYVVYNSGSKVVVHNIFSRDDNNKKLYYDADTRRRLNICVSAGLMTYSDVDTVVLEKKRMEIDPNTGTKKVLPDWE